MYKIVFYRILEVENSVMEELNIFLRAGRSITGVPEMYWCDIDNFEELQQFKNET
jgi:hypothetical protein